MSQWDKLLDRILTLSPDLRFDEIRKVLESYGYVMHGTSGGSSHFTFRKPGCAPVTVPKNDPVKKAYIELVKKAVENEEANKRENT